MKTSKRFDIGLILVLLIIVVVAVFFRRELRDELAYRFYKPTPAIAQLVRDAGFSEEGLRLFYLSRPQLVDRATLEANCSSGTLGCTTTQGQIFILEKGSGESSDDVIVTASHEMLHQAYRHLGDTARRSVDELTGTVMADSTDEDLKSRIESYTDQAEKADERHSILGSEVANISKELENYYATYFSDRTKTTSAQHNSLSHPQ